MWWIFKEFNFFRRMMSEESKSGKVVVKQEVLNEFLRLIEEESRTYTSYDQARNNFLTVLGQAKTLLVKVNRSGTDSTQERRQIFGQKIYEVVRAFVDRYPILKFIVEHGIDVEEHLKEQKLWSAVGVSETGKRALERAERDNFPAQCEMEKAQCVAVLEIFRFSEENKRSWLEELEIGTFTPISQTAYTTSVLRGGLLETGRLSCEVINQFDSLSNDIATASTRTDRRAAMEVVEKKRLLRMMEADYYREIWDLEDSLGMKSYLGTEPLSRGKKELRLELEAEGLSQLEMRAEVMKVKIQRKWTERASLAIHILSEQERSNSVKVAANEADIKHLMRVVLGGYMDLGKEVCLRLNATVDQDMASVLNQSIENGVGGEIYAPLANNNLCGVMRALEINFKNAPVSMMFLSLQELFQEQIDQEPTKVLEWVNSKAAMWAAFGYFDLFTPDVLFTFLTVFKMRHGVVRTKCMNVVLEKMRDNPEDFTPEVMKKKKSMGQVMVLKAEITNVIRDSTASDQFGEKKGQQQFPMKQNQQGIRRDYQRPVQILQSQAVAAPAMPKDVTTAHQAAVRPQPKLAPSIEGTVIPVGEGVNGEVKRTEKKLSIDQEGRTRVYAATKERCVHCDKGTAERHSPRCYGGRCDRCGFYGHSASGCRQAQSK